MELELKVGRVYRAKRPARVRGAINDRQIIWIDSLGVILQYDGPAVRAGLHYPKMTCEAFHKWAARDVTDELPSGEWAS